MSSVNNYQTGQIKLIPNVIVNTIGYKWLGVQIGNGRFEFGEQVQLSDAIHGVSFIVSSGLVLIASLLQ